MKFCIVIFLALAAAASATLQDDFKEIKALVPYEKIQKIIDKRNVLDNEFIKFQKFLKTNDFYNAWNTMINNEKFQALIEYAQESGADVISKINKIANLLKVPEYPIKLSALDMIMPRTVISFVDEIVKVLKSTGIPALMKSKMETSPEFKNFHDRVSGPEFHQLFMDVIHAPELKSTLNLFDSKGLKLNKVFDAAQRVLSWAV